MPTVLGDTGVKMAKGRSRSRNQTFYRDAADIARRSLVRTTPLVDLKALEDRRTFSPDGFRSPAKSFTTPRHRLTESITYPKSLQRKTLRYTKYPTYSPVISTRRIAFENPEDVAICVRRKTRREVLHALKKTGSRGQKPKRFSWYSSVSCKRRK